MAAGTGRRLSVVHVTEPVDGGVARYLLDAVADQAERGWSVAVVSPADPALAAAVERAGGEHVAWALRARHVPERTSHPLLPFLRAVRPLGRVLRARRPDLVHLHSTQAGAAGRLALRGSPPTVFQPHGWSFLAVGGPARRAALAWERLAARWARAIVCVSESERRLGKAVGIRGAWRVVPNGVDVERLQPPSAEERAAARTRLCPGAGPLVVCVGALRRQKGQDVLVAAWDAVRARVPDARLVLVGDGPSRRALEARAAEGVVVAGASDDVPSWLAVADVVAVPSRSEGLSLVLLEAMARSYSIVAADAGGTAEALGEAGAIVPTESPDRLADALATRLLDAGLRAREGARARERVVREHDIARTHELLARTYRELLGPPGR